MALQPESLFGPEVDQTQMLRAWPHEDGIRPGTLAAAASEVDLPNLTPLYFDDSAGFWKVWAGQTNEVNTITSDAATPATAGDFTLTVNGQETDPIAFDADAAEVQAALEALSNVAVGDVAVVASGSGTDLGDASHVLTITWSGNLAGLDITITADQTGISGGSDFVLATSTAGGDDAADGSKIDGFLWSPQAAHTTSTAGEQLVQIFRRGLIDARDVPVPSGESQADLNQALLASSLREKGIDLTGLAGVH